MLSIVIPKQERYKPDTREFIDFPETEIQLEHSLISISKWEAKWHKPFLSDEPKTQEETIDYIKCMALTQKVPELAYQMLTPENFKAVNEYLENPMTATWFSKKKSGGPGSKKVITSELIYYWMISYQVPFECQKWHLNRLLTLIHVCSVKNASPKKQSRNDTLKDYRSINAQRRAEAKAKMQKEV